MTITKNTVGIKVGEHRDGTPILVKNHIFKSNGKAVSVVEHSDGTLNIRNNNDVEVYDGKNWQTAYDIVLRELG